MVAEDRKRLDDKMARFEREMLKKQEDLCESIRDQIRVNAASSNSVQICFPDGSEKILLVEGLSFTVEQNTIAQPVAHEEVDVRSA